ncbi:MAG: metallophosphoesterase family protein, partial [Acidimicrobiia bacterium]
MRILLVSDLHYTLQQLDWVVAVAADYELVVVAGDTLDIASIVEPDAQIAVVLKYLARIAAKTTVVACSGNHDLNARNEHGERAAVWLDAARGSGVFVDGTHLEIDGALVTVCPWWDGPETREVVERQLGEDAARLDDRRWIWVYHAPPAASPTSWTGKRH